MYVQLRNAGGIKNGIVWKTKGRASSTKWKIGKLMNDYSKEKMDGPKYMKKMMTLTTSYQKKHKKEDETQLLLI